MKEETGTSIAFIFLGPLPPLLSWLLCSPGPFALLTPIWLSHSLGFFFKLLCLVLRNCRLHRILFRLDLYFPKIALDALNLVSADKLCLESHRQTLALGLTKHVFYNSLYFHRSQIEREERRIGLGGKAAAIGGYDSSQNGCGFSRTILVLNWEDRRDGPR